jgi:AcrR family transcriptional regulator
MVTVADIAQEAGVSSVTVFNHFPRKEDLFLDRSADAVELLRSAVRDRAPDVDVPASLRDMTLRLVDARHPLSGLNDRSSPFFRTVAASPALVARAREIASDPLSGPRARSSGMPPRWRAPASPSSPSPRR